MFGASARNIALAAGLHVTAARAGTSTAEQNDMRDCSDFVTFSNSKWRRMVLPATLPYDYWHGLARSAYGREKP